jgi:hypothetical protein
MSQVEDDQERATPVHFTELFINTVMSSEPFIRRNPSDNVVRFCVQFEVPLGSAEWAPFRCCGGQSGAPQDHYCGSEYSSERLSSLEGGQTGRQRESSRSSQHGRKPLPSRTRSEHSLCSKVEELIPPGSPKHHAPASGKHRWGRHLVILLCVAWSALAVLMVMQKPWLSMGIEWTRSHLEGIAWVYPNDRTGKCEEASR